MVSSMPLSYQGSLIKNFSFTFRQGQVVEYTAEEGLETLKMLLEADEGSRYLGRWHWCLILRPSVKADCCFTAPCLMRMLPAIGTGQRVSQQYERLPGVEPPAASGERL